MTQVSDEQFSTMIATALDELPEQYVRKLQNVAITYDDMPSETQRQKLQLRGNQTLFGLYEGIPRTVRSSGAMALPDKITIFKLPMLAAVHSLEQLQAQVKHTLWHEIAHHYGLSHTEIEAIESRWQ